jgi:catechol 2,3-dioxygenase-like lactoylglutathione lyase family enzyme
VGHGVSTPSDVIIRRTTLIVRDVVASRDFYTSVLGLEIWYDHPFVLGDFGVPGNAGDTTHLVILKAKDPVIGMLGLLQFVDPPKPAPLPVRDTVGIGDIVLVMQCASADALHATLVARGAVVARPPSEFDVRGADGRAIRMRGLSFFDPDGYFIEANQRL